MLTHDDKVHCVLVSLLQDLKGFANQSHVQFSAKSLLTDGSK